jgi:hypothetical protein
MPKFLQWALVFGLFFGSGLAGGIWISNMGSGPRIAALERTISDDKLAAATAGSKYEADIRRVEGKLADAQNSAQRSKDASRLAVQQFDDQRKRVDDFVKSSVGFATDIRDGIAGDLDLVDQCLGLLDRIEAGLGSLQASQ